MDIKACYKVLGLTMGASKTEVDSKYRELCKLYYPGSPFGGSKAREELEKAYSTVCEYLDRIQRNKEKVKAEDIPQFSLNKKPIKARLKSAIKLHGMKTLTAAVAVSGIFVAYTTIRDVASWLSSFDFGSLKTKDSIAIESEEPKSSIFDGIIELKPSSNEVTETPSSSFQDAKSQENKDTYVDEYGHVIENRDGVTYVDGILIVNKSYPLPNDYKPLNPSSPIVGENGVDFLDSETLVAFNEMQRDAREDGLNLWIASGYRSYNYQANLYNKYLKSADRSSVDTFSARAGYSEHQTGLAFDLNSVTQSFANTKEGQWVAQNCYKYGFIIRYPKGKDAETGYVYEPWHLRYVGKTLAEQLYNGGDWITMEAHFSLTSEYDYENENTKGYAK